MTVSFSPKIPLTSATTHYDMITDLAENIKQNFKNLLLTNPGERVMMPDFGCGLGRFLFEPVAKLTEVEVAIENTVLDQVELYLSYIVIDEIAIRNPISPEGFLLENRLDVYISYSVPSLKLTDEIIITA